MSEKSIFWLMVNGSGSRSKYGCMVKEEEML